MIIMPFAGCGKNKNEDNELEGIRWKSTLYGDVERFEDGIMYFEDFDLKFGYVIKSTEDTDAGKVYHIEISEDGTPQSETEQITVTVKGDSMTLETENTQETFELVKQNG